jgi:hypothetical protein
MCLSWLVFAVHLLPSSLRNWDKSRSSEPPAGKMSLMDACFPDQLLPRKSKMGASIVDVNIP